MTLKQPTAYVLSEGIEGEKIVILSLTLLHSDACAFS